MESTAPLRLAPRLFVAAVTASWVLLGCGSGDPDGDLYTAPESESGSGGSPGVLPPPSTGGAPGTDAGVSPGSGGSDPAVTPGIPASTSDPSDPTQPGPVDPTDPNPVDPTDPIPPPPPETDLIDDLEDGDISIIPSGGRLGKWYAYNDATPGVHPPAPAPVLDGANRVLHVSGTTTRPANEAYGGTAVELNNPGDGPTDPARQTYDVSGFTGFEFRAKGENSMRFEVVTRAVATTTQGGTCSGDGCFDSHGMDVRLTSEWQRFRVPLSALVQEGWGREFTFDPSGVMGVAFEHVGSGSYDFWIDDLGFYTEAPTETGDVTEPGPNQCGGGWGGYEQGSVTWYTFSQGTAAVGDVNCSFGIQQNPDRVGHVATGDGQYFAAMNTSDYEAAAACGACVQVTRLDTGESVTATVVDHCPVDSNPKCVPGHVDLSLAAFEQIGTEGEGYLGTVAGRGQISWQYVPCPTSEDVSFRLKEPSNAYWNMVIVEGHAYPIQSVQVYVDGTWMNASRAEYNFWLPPGGRMGTAPYRVRATDINGRTIEGAVSQTAASQSTGQQFDCDG